MSQMQRLRPRQPGPASTQCARRDGGSVTAETAVLLPALALVLALSLWAVAAVGAQLRCVDASRTAARALARGETPELALSAARTLAPRGAVVELSRDGDLAVVVVRVTARLPVPWDAAVPVLDISSRGTAVVEQ